MNTFEKILALLRCELWGEPLAYEVTADDIDGILAMAEEQGVSGLVANAIISSNLPIGEEKTVDVCTEQRLHELKCRDMDKVVGRFAGFLNRRNLKYVVMKGQTMATLYPHPLMRSCGDIDFYCPKDSFKEVKEVIEERLNVEMTRNLSEIHDNFKLKDTQFEMHSQLTSLGYFRHQRYWDALAQKYLDGEPYNVEIDGCWVRTLPPRLNAVYLLCHLMEHLSEKNFALKQLCDWGMLLYKHREEIDRQELAQHLEGLGLAKAGRVLGLWVVERLGFPKEVFPLSLDDKDAKWVRFIDRDFMYWTAKRKEPKKVSGGVSILHSLYTGTIVARKTLRFFWLAPAEMFWRFPRMAVWSVRKRM